MSNRVAQNCFDIPLFQVFVDKDVTKPLNEVILSGKLSQYEKVSEFEKNLSEYIGNDKILTLNSGTSALHLAYHLLKKPIKELNFPGLQIGDEVLTTPLTCLFVKQYSCTFRYAIVSGLALIN